MQLSNQRTQRLFQKSRSMSLFKKYQVHSQKTLINLLHLKDQFEQNLMVVQRKTCPVLKIMAQINKQLKFYLLLMTKIHRYHLLYSVLSRRRIYLSLVFLRKQCNKAWLSIINLGFLISRRKMIKIKFLTLLYKLNLNKGKQ